MVTKDWKKLKNFWNGYVWVKTWRNKKNNSLIQVSQTVGLKNGEVIYTNPSGYTKVIETTKNIGLANKHAMDLMKTKKLM